MSRPKFIAFSPKTQLASGINATDDSVEVVNVGSFPNVGVGEYGYITFLYDERASSENPAEYETATYTGKSGSTLTGLTRGVEGTAQIWAADTYCLSGNTAHGDDEHWTLTQQVEGSIRGFKNAITNGDFRINQRGHLTGGTLAAGDYAHDRWKSITADTDYTFSTTENKTTITIPATKEVAQIIEGGNLVSTDYTLSWEGSAQGKIGAGSYADSPITASVTGGTNLTITFGAGTLANVQFEAGSVATPFEQRPIGLELSLCQRYYFLCHSDGFAEYISVGWGSTDTEARTLVTYPVPMRIAPTMELYAAAGDYRVNHATAGETATGLTLTASSINGGQLRVACGEVVGLTGQGVSIAGKNIGFDAEI